MLEDIRKISNMRSRRCLTKVAVKELYFSAGFFNTNVTLYRLLNSFSTSSNGVFLKINHPSFQHVSTSTLAFFTTTLFCSIS